jgi:hypothetical protein
VLATRLEQAHIVLSPSDAETLGLEMGANAQIALNGITSPVSVQIDNSLAKGVVLVPRNVGLRISGPAPIEVKA